MNTPILIILFNRPDFAQRMFDVLKVVCPSQIFIVSDGPRNDEEKSMVQASRKIFDCISWDCKVEKNYSDINRGLLYTIPMGISWAFLSTDRLIILEDDCIPNEDFFRYCELMLEEYALDSRVFSINGYNYNPSLSNSKSGSYFFSKYANSWGWATWKRAWEYYDGNLDSFQHKDLLTFFKYIFPIKYRSSFFWKYKIGQVYSGKIESWAYRWMFSLWINHGLAIVPKDNLIRNIGNDVRSTNTKGNLHFLKIETGGFPHRISHPKFVAPSYEYDKYLENAVHSKSFYYRLRWIFQKALRQI